MCFLDEKNDDPLILIFIFSWIKTKAKAIPINFVLVSLWSLVTYSLPCLHQYKKKEISPGI